MSRGETISFDGVTCLKETDAALLCRLDDGREIWFPKSQVDDDSEVFDDDSNAAGTLVVTEWVCLQKGLL